MMAVTKREPNAPHFRIVLPEYLKGTKHVARQARVFMTLPGQEEIELSGVVWAKSGWYVDDVTAVEVKMLGSVEVTYE